MEDNNEYILKRINKYFFNQALEIHNEILGDNSYRFFMLPLEFVSGMLESIKTEVDLKGKRFLDVGSGTGYICGLAEQMGMIAEGIEMNPTLFEISTQMFPEIKFYNMNCNEFEKYGEYDIIYYWLPFREDRLKDDFKQKIEKEIKIGGFILLGEEENQDAGKDSRFISLDGDKFHNKIWKKIGG